jgi:hypothetical protein
MPKRFSVKAPEPTTVHKVVHAVAHVAATVINALPKHI